MNEARAANLPPSAHSFCVSNFELRVVAVTRLNSRCASAPPICCRATVLRPRRCLKSPLVR